MLKIHSVSKSLDGNQVLRDVSLEINQGEFFSIVGPSGCGKTTLLRILAGFETPDSGSVLWNQEDISLLPSHKRPFNLVFQRYALFPHMNVFGNVAFGPSVKGWNKAQATSAVKEALSLVGMEEFETRKIETLSGGQQQRVALARAIVNKPEVILLDEPLSALDQKLREKMRIELLRIQRSLGITFILVTHDQEEALTMSDKIALFNKGKVEQCGSPEDIYRRPKSAFVADFIGAINAIKIGSESLYVRPEDIQISKENFAPDPAFQMISNATIREILFKGAVTDFVVDIDPEDSTAKPVIIQTSSAWQNDLNVGIQVSLRWKNATRFKDQGNSL